MDRRAFLTGLLASTGLARARAQETLGGLLTGKVEGAGAGYVIVSPCLAALIAAETVDLLEPPIEGRLGTIKGFQFIS